MYRLCSGGFRMLNVHPTQVVNVSVVVDRQVVLLGHFVLPVDCVALVREQSLASSCRCFDLSKNDSSFQPVVHQDLSRGLKHAHVR